jgi:hypothetical protein
MPPDDAEAKLEVAIASVADALAQLSPAAFDRLCKQEPAEIITRQQYFEVAGVPDAFPPELVIGHRVIELLAERHPHVLGGPDEAA